MHYLLSYDFVENIGERRAPYREEHLKLVREAHERGEIVMAGAAGERPDGAVLVFRTNDVQDVEGFVKKDPYAANRLVTQWRVQPWTVVVSG
ncbi:MAG: hypothetical protein HYY65_12535 [Candidatus Tectomicrobia bacterium]|uniref:YCII-related domain-containing protein n=1 Tax=Tectimicrobiota bacterium TaxID=2528274 RepID=A0A932M2F6_UNCTE|nr:hypothetical protein [Candidatus Tectomicrobia bacterium]